MLKLGLRDLTWGVLRTFPSSLSVREAPACLPLPEGEGWGEGIRIIDACEKLWEMSYATAATLNIAYRIEMD